MFFSRTFLLRFAFCFLCSLALMPGSFSRFRWIGFIFYYVAFSFGSMLYSSLSAADR
ncbi:hypothetical protein NBRC111894_1830 [Sporolactobacillus inulinus]|uniref:Uncharacterized protein n=1 Tax=Sporolactobacillus inulinus TaxID=2078 RepID=A0A4Y1ZB27_9BACL|nr:hypothetical protein NBRC111894_1830 [Sporolactobacillus inulinus]